MSTDDQSIKWRRNIAKTFNRLSRVHDRFRQTTDDSRRAMTYSEREREFTFAKKSTYIVHDGNHFNFASGIKR